MIKKYFYTTHDGHHFPDANKGDDLFYAIDLADWLNLEEDTLTSVEWDYPKQISSSEDFLVGMQAHIKLLTDKRGNFRVTCKITSTENGKTQTNAIPFMLTVY